MSKHIFCVKTFVGFKIEELSETVDAWLFEESGDDDINFELISLAFHVANSQYAIVVTYKIDKEE